LYFPKTHDIYGYMKSGIYKITNVVNGKFYIGSSKEIEKRWDDHKQYLRGGYHINPKLQHAWDFYGEDKFVFDVIEEVQPDEKLLLEREQYHLDLWKPYHRTIGYNICETSFGGDTLKNHPRGKEIIQEWKDKYGELYSGEGNPMFGRNHTKESIKKQKDKAVGRYTLDWFIERNGQVEGERKFRERNEMLKNRKMNYSYDNKMTGIKRGPMSQEIKNRISEKKAKMKLIREDLQKDILSNQYTMIQLSEKYGVSMSTIKAQKRKVL